MGLNRASLGKLVMRHDGDCCALVQSQMFRARLSIIDANKPDSSIYERHNKRFVHELLPRYESNGP